MDLAAAEVVQRHLCCSVLGIHLDRYICVKVPVVARHAVEGAFPAAKAWRFSVF